ncbi:hypothetical protein O9929_13150 [Vibrio lentus]|nr:hypothetical protein [Vibrio lentus]
MWCCPREYRKQNLASFRQGQNIRSRYHRDWYARKPVRCRLKDDQQLLDYFQGEHVTRASQGHEYTVTAADHNFDDFLFHHHKHRVQPWLSSLRISSRSIQTTILRKLTQKE